MVDVNEGNEQLFHYAQFLVATCCDQARVGTFSVAGRATSWSGRTPAPTPMAEVAAELGKTVEALSEQEKLVAGMLRPATCWTSCATSRCSWRSGGRTVKVGLPLPAVPRRAARHPAAAHRQDPRPGRRARPARRHRLAHPGQRARA